MRYARGTRAQLARAHYVQLDLVSYLVYELRIFRVACYLLFCVELYETLHQKEFRS